VARGFTPSSQPEKKPNGSAVREDDDAGGTKYQTLSFSRFPVATKILTSSGPPPTTRHSREAGIQSGSAGSLSLSARRKKPNGSPRSRTAVRNKFLGGLTGRVAAGWSLKGKTRLMATSKQLSGCKQAIQILDCADLLKVCHAPFLKNTCVSSMQTKHFAKGFKTWDQLIALDATPRSLGTKPQRGGSRL